MLHNSARASFCAPTPLVPRESSPRSELRTFRVVRIQLRSQVTHVRARSSGAAVFVEEVCIVWLLRAAATVHDRAIIGAYQSVAIYGGVASAHRRSLN